MIRILGLWPIDAYCGSLIKMWIMRVSENARLGSLRKLKTHFVDFGAIPFA
jgi:hypothetical protein